MSDPAMSPEALAEEVRLMDPATGKDLPSYDELVRTQQKGAARAEAEAAQRRAAEAGRRAAEEGRRAAEEGRRAAEEGRRAAEARIAELEA